MTPEFQALSRKAATGSLSAAEQAALEALLREDPHLQAELDWDAAFAARLEEKVAAMPAMPGWERTAALLQADHAAMDVARAGPRARPVAERGPGILDRISDWFTSTLGVSFNGQAIAVAVVFVQAAAIGLLSWQYGQEADYGESRGVSADPAPRGPLLRVAFKPDLREAELRRALAAVGGEIVGGPGQIGVYLVRIKEGNLAAAAERLRASGSTDLVEIVEPKR